MSETSSLGAEATGLANSATHSILTMVDQRLHGIRASTMHNIHDLQRFRRFARRHGVGSLLALGLVCSLVGAAAASGDPKSQSTGSSVVSETAAGIVDRLTEQFGCNETLVAANPEATAVLVVQVRGILERSRGADLPYTEELQVGGPGIAVRLEQGADLDYWCTDMMARPPRIDAAWVGVSGVATVVVERRVPKAASGGGTRPTPAAAVVRLGPTVLARDDDPDQRLTIRGLEIAATLGEPAGG